ncbi:MAG: hypothetical protein ACRDTG_02990 [Pseudonocardiaceae bacterium]
MAKEPSDPDGSHKLPYGEQGRRTVEGRRIDSSGACTVIAIRDGRRPGRVLYPHGEVGLGVLIADVAAQRLADRAERIGDWS